MSVLQEKLQQVLEELPRYEPRPQQTRMAQIVERAVAEGIHAVVEAGTGSGKTMAYLIPLLGQDERAVVSTGTIALQSQLMEKDLAFLEQHYGRPFAFALAKGRQNYLCPEHMEEADRTLPPVGEDRVQLDNVIQLWRSGSWDGDSSNLPFKIENRLWRQELTASSEECHGSRCRHFHECPFVLARRKLEDANIIVANHALYMTDVAAGFAVLPKHRLVVFDEAHKIEEAATSAFTVQIGRYATRHLLRRITKRLKGMSYKVEQTLANADEAFFQWVESTGYRSRRLYSDPRLHRVSMDFTEALEGVAEFVDEAPMEDYQLFEESAEAAKTKAAALKDSLVMQTHSLQARWQHFAEVLSNPAQSDHVQWIECMEPRRGETRTGAEAMMFTLYSAPLHVADFLKENLWPHKTAIATSATLATGESMDYIKGRWGLSASMDVVLPPVFDYETQAILYAPKGIPNPNTPHFNRSIAQTSIPLISLTKGRTLFLFTSFKAMREVADILRASNLSYPLRTQDDAPRPRLLQWFRGEQDPVLLATASFWEGVDIPGETLSSVIIDRLPFAHPEDPVVQANTEQLKAEGRDWFNEYSLPNAILSLKQGFGRLIRSHQDTGVVCIMDPRLITMRYGDLILKSLPPAPLVRTLDDPRLQKLFNVPVLPDPSFAS